METDSISHTKDMPKSVEHALSVIQSAHAVIEKETVLSKCLRFFSKERKKKRALYDRSITEAQFLVRSRTALEGISRELGEIKRDVMHMTSE